MKSIREAYENQGVKEFYETQGDSYRNPHVKAVQAGLKVFLEKSPVDLSSVLDWGCGSGEVSEVLSPLTQKLSGSDPYTFKNYTQRLGLPCQTWKFEDVALIENYSLVVMSYCLHLLEPSRLPSFLFQLSQKTQQMLIISPHKKPVINSPYWTLTSEIYLNRVRYRLYSKVE